MSALDVVGLFIELGSELVEALRSHTEDEKKQYAAAIAQATLVLGDFVLNEDPKLVTLASFEIRARGEVNIQLAQVGYDGDNLPFEVHAARELAVLAARRAFEKRGAK